MHLKYHNRKIQSPITVHKFFMHPRFTPRNLHFVNDDIVNIMSNIQANYYAPRPLSFVVVERGGGSA